MVMSFSHALEVLGDLSRALLSTPPNEFLQQVAAKANELLSTSACIVWCVDKRRGRLRVAATSGNVDEHFRRVELQLDAPGVRTLLRGKSRYLRDVRHPQPDYYLDREETDKHGWVSS